MTLFLCFGTKPLRPHRRPARNIAIKRWKQRRNLGPRLGITAKAAEHQIFELNRHGRPVLSNRRWRLQNLRIGVALPHLRKWKLGCEQLAKCGARGHAAVMCRQPATKEGKS